MHTMATYRSRGFQLYVVSTGNISSDKGNILAVDNAVVVDISRGFVNAHVISACVVTSDQRNIFAVYHTIIIYIAGNIIDNAD